MMSILVLSILLLFLQWLYFSRLIPLHICGEAEKRQGSIHGDQIADSSSIRVHFKTRQRQWVTVSLFLLLVRSAVNVVLQLPNVNIAALVSRNQLRLVNWQAHGCDSASVYQGFSSWNTTSSCLLFPLIGFWKHELFLTFLLRTFTQRLSVNVLIFTSNVSELFCQIQEAFENRWLHLDRFYHRFCWQIIN